jgi:hypothetical protein
MRFAACRWRIQILGVLVAVVTESQSPIACSSFAMLPAFLLVGILDFAGVVLFGIFATFFGWLPTGSFHVFSWGVAVALLIVTSLQWMLIGASIEKLLRRHFARHAHV